MDMFTDKLAQKLAAQEIISANSQADAEQMTRLKNQIVEYDECLHKMRGLIEEGTTMLANSRAGSEDVNRLISVLNRLVDSGNSMIVIEHNLDMIKTADYIIDLGPEGGDKGGTVVDCGTPEEIAKNPKSYTGQFLKKMLK